ncbi:MAG TPA: macro domain-containing protein, partial [Defluviitaleaceae bacterium]|nr:macro domain-containing protein [Defluviitaleaceae bacterium]
YYNSLKLAKEYNLDSVAFPSISTGAYGYPIEKAVKVAVKAVLDFIEEEDFPRQVKFVLFSERDFSIYDNYLKEVLKEN